MISSPAWREYICSIAQTARERDDYSSSFPVSLDRNLKFELDEQALRWDIWNGFGIDQFERLIADLTHEFCRIIRHRLDRLRHPDDAHSPISRYLENIEVFISHSKMIKMARRSLVKFGIGYTNTVRCRASLMCMIFHPEYRSKRFCNLRLVAALSLRCRQTLIPRANGADAK